MEEKEKQETQDEEKLLSDEVFEDSLDFVADVDDLPV